MQSIDCHGELSCGVGRRSVFVEILIFVRVEV